MISIMINTYNRSQMLINNLENLKPLWDSLEIVVIDDCSSDNTKEAMEKFIAKNRIKRIRYIRNEMNKGYAKSLNIGIKSCSGEFIVILNDDDTLLETENFLKILNNYNTQNYLLGTKLIMEQKKTLLKKTSSFIYRAFGETFAGEVYNYNGNKRRFVNYCNNDFGFPLQTNMFFDEKSYVKNVFRIESDFQIRYRKNGLKIIYDPNIKILSRYAQFGGLRESKTNFLLYCIYNHITFLRKNFKYSKYYKIPLYFILKSITHPNMILNITKTFNDSFKHTFKHIYK